MADIYDKAKRSEIMSLVRHSRTAPEEQVASLLTEIDIKYRRNDKSLPGSPDFVIDSARTAIFVHGCFWHGHQNCRLGKRPKTNKAFWEKKVSDNKKRDSRIARLLRKQGWSVMTIWQCRLRKPDVVLNRLKEMLHSLR